MGPNDSRVTSKAVSYREGIDRALVRSRRYNTLVFLGHTLNSVRLVVVLSDASALVLLGLRASKHFAAWNWHEN